jgi:hypothetical protein
MKYRIETGERELFVDDMDGNVRYVDCSRIVRNKNKNGTKECLKAM